MVKRQAALTGLNGHHFENFSLGSWKGNDGRVHEPVQNKKLGRPGRGSPGPDFKKTCTISLANTTPQISNGNPENEISHTNAYHHESTMREPVAYKRLRN